MRIFGFFNFGAMIPSTMESWPILSETIKGVKVVESKDFPAKQGESLILLE